MLTLAQGLLHIIRRHLVNTGCEVLHPQKVVTNVHQPPSLRYLLPDNQRILNLQLGINPRRLLRNPQLILNRKL